MYHSLRRLSIHCASCLSTGRSGAGHEVGNVEFGTALNFAGGVTAEWLYTVTCLGQRSSVDYQSAIKTKTVVERRREATDVGG